MRFTKMHGTGNSYIYINCFDEHVENPNALSRFVSDKNFGIGSDGLILICPSDIADVKMRMFNADGSESKMCGNGVRCVGRYAFDNRLAKSKDGEVTVETAAGIKKIFVKVNENKTAEITVDMGEPILECARIPVASDFSDFISRAITVSGAKYLATAVSMGNPHCVVFSEDIDKLNLEEIGPLFEHHPLFPERVNTEFIQIISRGEVKMRVWERGSGETLACGTGACAAAVAGVLNNLTDRKVLIHLRGGDLVCEWRKIDNRVYMTGNAQYICCGELF